MTNTIFSKVLFKFELCHVHITFSNFQKFFTSIENVGVYVSNFWKFKMWNAFLGRFILQTFKNWVRLQLCASNLENVCVWQIFLNCTLFISDRLILKVFANFLLFYYSFFNCENVCNCMLNFFIRSILKYVFDFFFIGKTGRLILC